MFFLFSIDSEITKLYEAQYQKNKTEENLLQLFFCHVKADALDKQKEVCFSPPLILFFVFFYHFHHSFSFPRLLHN